MTYEEAIALIKSGKPLSKKIIWDITDLGYAIYYGKQGFERDPYKGVELYNYSAEQGDAVAEYNLGLAYDEGIGVEEIDWDKAAYWYERAARNGRTDAMVNLAWLLYHGLVEWENSNRDRESDKKQAVSWYRKTSKKGDMLAITHLGDCYFYGDGDVVKTIDSETIQSSHK